MQLLKDFNLKKYNTFKIDVVAKYFFDITNQEGVDYFLYCISEAKEKFLILGGGSNVLFKTKRGDSIYDGIVFKNSLKGMEILSETAGEVTVRVSSGEDWDGFVQWTAERNYYGLENLSHIPGTVGGAPVQNIGAYGVEVKDYITAVECVDIAESIQQNKTIIKTFTNEECEFYYRDSVFKENKNKYFILSVTFNLSKIKKFNLEYKDTQDYIKNKESEGDSYLGFKLTDIRNMIINIRNSKMPNWLEEDSLGTAGSFFKNIIVSESQYNDLMGRHFESLEQENIYKNIPAYKIERAKTPPAPLSDFAGLRQARGELETETFYKLSSGYIIDKILNMRNIREGDVGTFENQTLVIVNYDNATGQEVYDFSQKIIDKCFEVTGLTLEREVNVL